MKTFAFLLPAFLLVNLLLPPSLQATTSSEPNEKYCNARFGFCVEFSKTFFPKKDIAANNDGVVLTSADGDVQVRISGYFNVMGNSIQDEYGEYLTMKKRSFPSLKNATVLFNGDEFESTLQVGNETHYARIVLLNDNFVIVTIISNRRGLNKPENSIDSVKEGLLFNYDS